MINEDVTKMLQMIEVLDSDKNLIEKTDKYSNLSRNRRPSLPQIPIEDIKKQNSNPSLIPKSLFFNERSVSISDISKQSKTENKKYIKLFQDTARISVNNNSLNPNNIEAPNYSMKDQNSVSSINTNDVILIESEVQFREARNSIEMLKKKQNRHSNLSDKCGQSSFEDKNKTTGILKSAPQSLRNSKCGSDTPSTSIPSHNNSQDGSTTLSEFQTIVSLGINKSSCPNESIDSGICTTVPNAKKYYDRSPSVLITTNRQSGSFETEQASSGNTDCSNFQSPSSLHISNEAMDYGCRPESDYEGNYKAGNGNSETKDQFNNMDDQDDKLTSSGQSGKKQEVISIKVVKSEEEKNEFLRMVSKTISEGCSQRKEIIRFYMQDDTYSSQVVDKSQTAFDICNILKSKFNINSTSFCQLIEHINAESLERVVEDHENILDLFYSWKSDSLRNKFYFKENPMAYKIFTHPNTFKSEMECDFELVDNLWIKEPRTKWKKIKCIILNSMLYFIVKPGSKDHNDLFCLVKLKDVDIYTCVDEIRAKKIFKCPTTDLIVFKSNKLEHKASDQACIAATSPIQKERWIEALRIAKFHFNQLKKNYIRQEELIQSQPFRTRPSSLNVSETLLGDKNQYQ